MLYQLFIVRSLVFSALVSVALIGFAFVSFSFVGYGLVGFCFIGLSLIVFSLLWARTVVVASAVVLLTVWTVVSLLSVFVLTVFSLLFVFSAVVCLLAVVTLCITLTVVLAIVVLLFLLRLVKTAQVSFCQEVAGLRSRFCLTILDEAQRLLACLVHLDDFPSTFCADGLQIGSQVLVGRIGDKTCQNVNLELMVFSIGSLQESILRRQLLLAST